MVRKQLGELGKVSEETEKSSKDETVARYGENEHFLQENVVVFLTLCFCADPSRRRQTAATPSERTASTILPTTSWKESLTNLLQLFPQNSSHLPPPTTPQQLKPTHPQQEFEPNPPLHLQGPLTLAEPRQAPQPGRLLRRAPQRTMEVPV